MMLFCVPFYFYVGVEHPPSLFTSPLARTSRPSLSILSSPGPQSVTPFKVEIQRKVSSLSVADVWGAVKDLSTMFTFIRLLSSGARYLVEMVVCHRDGGNQNFHCAPHKVESSLNYSEVGIII